METLLIALALAMDCFAVSVVCAVIARKKNLPGGIMWRLAFFFGLFQALMPLIGWLLTNRFSHLVQAWDHWIAFGLLAFIGGRMIVSSFKEEEDPSLQPQDVKTELLLAIATSIDALAVGISYACTGYNTLSQLSVPLVIIGVVSFLMSLLGYGLGLRFGDIVNRKIRPELVGGLILVGIGIKILVTHLGLAGGEREPVPAKPDVIEQQLQSMTLREKVGQLFCVRPEAFDVSLEWDSYAQLASYQVQDISERMLQVNREYPVGGIILFAHNIQDPEQLKELVSKLKAFNGAPLLYIDEEGGRVARIGNNDSFGVEKFPPMGTLGKSGDLREARRCGKVIGTYLKQYGIDVDLAPVADVNTNPNNPVIGTRAFSSDPTLAAKLMVQYMKGLEEAGVISCLKHFPGHGDTGTDSHYGYAQTRKSWEEMLDCEMITFKAGIAAGAPMIMTAHIAAPAITGDNTPATVSREILEGKLRGELGFDKVIITDAMAMGAITRQYNSAQATLLSLQAGADIILGPKNFIEAFDAVLAAVESGALSEERIDQSVRRILRMRASYAGR